MDHQFTTICNTQAQSRKNSTKTPNQLTPWFNNLHPKTYKGSHLHHNQHETYRQKKAEQYNMAHEDKHMLEHVEHISHNHNPSTYLFLELITPSIEISICTLVFAFRIKTR